ncbi:hypothetical protein [Yoonia sp. I 8.24]|uniref:hypothetical protein n=1 Tax=Yoonia sp. I 8.24 TaxID=1537229 RepID=UPI001EDD8787|nr:hypothetical protein [Yoonia sp. I 8.24]MCG3267192.1 hypothetical protein [Yoonia sp. I 8.24]
MRVIVGILIVVAVAISLVVGGWRLVAEGTVWSVVLGILTLFSGLAILLTIGFLYTILSSDSWGT